MVILQRELALNMKPIFILIALLTTVLDCRAVIYQNVATTNANPPLVTTNQMYPAGTNPTINTNILFNSGSAATTIDGNMVWNPSYNVPVNGNQITGAYTNSYWIEGLDIGSADVYFGDFVIVSNQGGGGVSSTLFNGASGVNFLAYSTSLTNGQGAWTSAGGTGFVIPPPTTLFSTNLNFPYYGIIPATNLTGIPALNAYDIVSNTWSLTTASNGMANWANRITSSNGTPVVIFNSNGVAFVKYLSPPAGGIIP